jgi:hypothetical protein
MFFEDCGSLKLEFNAHKLLDKGSAMEWYKVFILILGCFLSWYYAIKSVQNLTDEGEERSYLYLLSFWRSDIYYTEKGQKYRSVSLIISVITLLIFVIFMQSALD